MIDFSVQLGSIASTRPAAIAPEVSAATSGASSGVDFKALLARVASATESASAAYAPQLPNALTAGTVAASQDTRRTQALLQAGSSSLEEGMALLQVVHASSLRVLVASQISNSVTQSINQLTTRMS